MADPKKVLVLGCNFAGLGAAQKIKHYAKDTVDVTCIDRKAYLDFIPNIPLESFEGRDPSLTMHMPIIDALKKDNISFVQAEIEAIDVKQKSIRLTPNERPGAPSYQLTYDYLVVALGARLAYDDIPGFAEYGHTVSDAFHANKLMAYLEHDYKGGSIAVGSARFEQGKKGRPEWLPTALAACEGPPVEVSLSLAHWLEQNGKGGPKNITIFTPGSLIAEDAGEKVVEQLLTVAGSMGFSYKNKTEGIEYLDEKGIQFSNGDYVEAELKIIFPNWKPHAFMKGLPISDEVGFVITDMRMRNPQYPEIFACGDAAALTVPKLGAIGHQQCEVVGKQIAADLGQLPQDKADEAWMPEVVCIGDIGGGKAFYIHATSWFGGDQQTLKMGRVPYSFKVAYQKMFFENDGKIPNWGLPVAEWLSETL